MILAGDIGGTNTRLALFEKNRMVGDEKKFSSKNYLTLETIVSEFLEGKKVEKACFGIAGPVHAGQCKATNLPWLVDSSQIRQHLQIPSVFLINDLEANAYGIQVLKKEDFFLLQKGVEQEGNQALIAAGTGLGEAGMIWDGKKHRPFACEGGHADFAPRNELEIELFLYLKKKYQHVSYERLLSGPGLLSLFQFLIDTKKETLSDTLREEMKKGDPIKIISEWGCKNKDEACIRALNWFISIYGAEAGNTALKFLALGGFYIGGGIAPKILEKMKQSAFCTSFQDKGRFKDLLASIPIWVILNDHAALLGAAHYATIQ